MIPTTTRWLYCRNLNFGPSLDVLVEFPVRVVTALGHLHLRSDLFSPEPNQDTSTLRNLIISINDVSLLEHLVSVGFYAT